MDLRNYLPKLFQGKQNKEMLKIIDSKFQELTFFKQYFNTVDLYQNDIARSCAKRIATDVAQVIVKHQLRKAKNYYEDVEYSNIMKLLRIRPNAFQTPFDYFYQVTLNLILDKVSYTYIETDDRGYPIALIPIEVGSYSMHKISNKYYVKFTDLQGNNVLADLEMLIVNRWDQPKMIENESPFKLVKYIVDLLDTNYSAMKSAMTNGGKINALLKFAGMLDDEMIKAAIERFQKYYLNVNNYKIAGLDSTVEFQQLNPSNWETLDLQQMNFLKEKMYNYIGINQNIVEGKATESEFLSYIAMIVDPLVTNMGQEYSYKIFSKKELELGNRLFFDTTLLKFSTLSAKTAYYDKMLSHGVLSINEVRAMEGLSPIEYGDVHRVTLNGVTLDKADEYQLGKPSNEGGDEDGKGKTEEKPIE